MQCPIYPLSKRARNVTWEWTHAHFAHDERHIGDAAEVAFSTSTGLLANIIIR